MTTQTVIPTPDDVPSGDAAPAAAPAASRPDTECEPTDVRDLPEDPQAGIATAIG